MDEATNSLDKKSEEMITNQINLIKKEKTIILITHNLKALKYCDKIYKINNKMIQPAEIN